MPVEKIVSNILSSMCQVWLLFMIYYRNETSEYNLDEQKQFFLKGYQNYSCFKFYFLKYHNVITSLFILICAEFRM